MSRNVVPESEAMTLPCHRVIITRLQLTNITGKCVYCEKKVSVFFFSVFYGWLIPDYVITDFQPIQVGSKQQIFLTLTHYLQCWEENKIDPRSSYFNVLSCILTFSRFLNSELINCES